MSRDVSAVELFDQLQRAILRATSAEATLWSVAASLRDAADDTADPESAVRLRALASQLDGGES